jgi:uncharacterized repeat protein (TIGR01451 family)
MIIPIGDIDGSKGFALALSENISPRQMPVILPARGEEPLTFFAGSNRTIQVQPTGTHGQGRVVGHAVAYDADHGTSYWAATETGYEEWLRVDNPSDGVVASYAITGASAEQRGESVVLLDNDGLALLDVEAPAAWTTDGRAVDVWVEARDNHIDLSIALPEDVQGPIIVDPVWTRVDDLGYGRMLHTATRLLDGRVIHTGGVGEANDGPLDLVDIFDPRTDTWSSVAPMPVPMRSHHAVLLLDGRVLVMGWNGYIYDVETDTWTQADPTKSLLGGPSVPLSVRSVVLPDGKVLITGRYCCSGKEAMVYDPERDQFEFIEDMKVHRLAHTLTVLPDGSVLAAGGGTTNPSGLNSNTAELYLPDWSAPDPYLDGTWQQLPDMSSGHMDHAASLLTQGPNAGKVLICSGLDGASVPGSYLFNDECHLYDPEAQTFSLAGSVAVGRQRSGTGNGGEFLAMMEAGPEAGNLIFAGGWPETWRTDLYDVESDVWTEGCWLNEARLRHSTVPLEDGTVLLTGGQMWAYAPYSTPIRSVERLDFTNEDGDCDGIADPFDICDDNPEARDYNPVDKWCGEIAGRVYFDDNEDCVDNGEPPASGVLIRADLPGQQTRYALTNEDGEYAFDLPDGLWDITMVARDYLEPVEICGGIAKSYTVDPILGGNDLTFGLKPGCEGIVSISSQDPGANAECNGLPYNSPCPGSDWLYVVNLTNQGSPWTPGNPSSVLTVTLPAGMDYVGPTLSTCVTSETAVQGNPPLSEWTITYELSNIGSGDSCQFAIPTYVDTIPLGGWQATADLTAQCGNDTLIESAGVLDLSECSCDPNDKKVFPGGCDLAGTVEVAQPLDYTVRFQNLGLGPAHDVMVTDTLDTDLELESMRLLYTSHDITSLQIDETGKVVVRYQDIELPAAIDDALGSMGGFQYRIEPSVTDLGTEYTNTADIFFDQNEVVVTNEVVTTIGECNLPPGHALNGPARAGVANGTNPGQGIGLQHNPTGGSMPNPHNTP